MANFDIAGYELYEILGRGGMAVVYRALHLNLDREVAIKVMDTALNSDETFSERFIREARISARLVHPHILQIYDVNSFDTLNYISMELLEGGDLSDFIRSEMTQRTIYLVMEQMTEALDYAAAKGYVHRDIKPSNIMLRDDTDYVLADFGIAKAANSGTQMTQTGLMVGTPSYMSPEQAKGIEVDGRSDLYSLAVLCYEMLTKELPFDSDSAVSTAVKHLTEEVPKLPENIAVYQPFIDKAMAKNADDRYQTGREMYQAFCEIRSQFSDDDVLTAGRAPSEKKTTGEEGPDDSRTSIAWDDSTQVASPSRPSRPYKLSDTSRRESLVSGIRSGQRPAAGQSSTFGSTGFRLFAGAVVTGALAFGGYSFWEGKQTTSTEDLRSVTSEMAQAYGALNNEELEKAAIAFRKVLSIDSGHAAAQQGLSEVEAGFVTAIEGAVAAGDQATAARMFSDFALLFADSSSYDRLFGTVEQSKQDQQLESVQSDRIEILLGNADKAMAEGKLFAPATGNAHEFIKQAISLDSDSIAAGESLDKLVTAALEQIYTFVDGAQFGEARDLLNRIRLINPDFPLLPEAQTAVERAEETELKRQERWAEYTPEKQQSILEQLSLAEDHLAKGILTAREQLAEGENAEQYFLAVLELDPDNASAGRGPGRIAKAYIVRAEEAVTQNRFDDAETLLANASTVSSSYPALQHQQDQLLIAREAYEDRAEMRAEVDRLLTQANDELSRVDEGVGHAEKATRLYREALQADPQNAAALAGLEQVIEYYIVAGNEAAAYGEFKTATAALKSAQALAPEREDIGQLLAGLSDKEAVWVTGQNVTVLLETGQQLADQGDFTAAAEKFSTALHLEADSIAARDSLDAAVESLVQRARGSIGNGDFASASNDLASAGDLAPEREDVVDLAGQIPALELAWRENEQVALDLESAQALYNKGSLSKAAAAYDAVLASSPDSIVAREGFEKSIAALVKHAGSAASRGDFATARKSLGSAQNLSPDNAASANLQADLPRLEQEWQQQLAAAQEEKEMADALANTGLTALANGDLDMAAETFSQLNSTHPELDATRRLKNQLLTAYVAATRDEITNKEFDAAEDYVIRGQVLAPNYAAWAELEDEIEVSRASSRRRIGAY